MTGEVLERALREQSERDEIVRLVVGAAVFREGKILLLRRRPDDFLPGIFELPGGQVEQGETIFNALSRELREETRLTLLTVRRYVGHFDYVSGSGKPCRQFNFIVDASDDSIHLEEHTEFTWRHQPELGSLKISDSTRAAIDAAFKAQEISLSTP
jgi:8-oxo-dGTP diphosphatase